ncbi:MAG TPA: hypothetical protein VGA65_02555 [Hyphomicrobium sp.]|jgi:hypothetical protein
MADELKRYWFVAAVFREPHDLASTIGALRDNGFAGNRLLIIANHRAEDTRKAAGGSEVDRVPVVAVDEDGAIKAGASDALPTGLCTLLDAMSEGDAREHGTAGAAVGSDGAGRSQVYAQLRRDVAGGAVVLIADVADSDEQLLGARILLRGNCECVLTHEIAAHGS